MNVCVYVCVCIYMWEKYTREYKIQNSINTDETRKRKLEKVHITYTAKTNTDARPLAYLYRTIIYRVT